ncbi:uncharacterized protein LOC111063748 [Nilaparvata lugens]|uniref:uncharacterized protein LOC111063748 n=1 Tax=Nilaparvata lugens TaxID=108931 RepID=UPI00193EC129|nr:uncharacterized protein LOC111063748 [Nilaparvata lugens]
MIVDLRTTKMKSKCLMLLLLFTIVMELESKSISNDLLCGCKIPCPLQKVCPKGAVSVKDPNDPCLRCPNCPYCAFVRGLFGACNYKPGEGSRPETVHICGENLTCVFDEEDEQRGVCLPTLLVCPPSPDKYRHLTEEELYLPDPDNWPA